MARGTVGGDPFGGRKALVTGAASGLGRSLAVALARRGCDVVVVDVDEDGLDETGRLVSGCGRRVLQRHVDVSDRAEMENLAAEVISEWGGVDILINNAGVGVGGELVHVPLDDIEWIVGINLMGEIYGTRTLLPQMIGRGGGHIVNVASLSALVVLPYHIAYTTTKHALAGFSGALWVELRKYNIGVTLVCPGAVRTNIMEHTRTHGVGKEKAGGLWQRLLASAGKDPDRVAARVLDAIERDRFLVLTGAEAYVLYCLQRLSPSLARRIAVLAERLVAARS